MKYYPGTTIYEISINLSFIKRYMNEETDCEFFTYDELCGQIDRYLKSPYPMGLLLHHRYHVTDEHFILIEKVLDYLNSKGASAVRIEDIYHQLENFDEKN